MCVISMIQEDFSDRWRKQWENWPTQPTNQPSITIGKDHTKEIAELRQMLLDQKKILEDLMQRAKKYDREHNQPDCNLEDKRKSLQDLADKMGLGQINWPE